MKNIDLGGFVVFFGFSAQSHAESYGNYVNTDHFGSETREILMKSQNLVMSKPTDDGID